jgi:multiple sugar transport system ATP-binding protein
VARIVLDHVSKLFGDVVAVDDVTLSIDDGEFMVLVGPSGCGKTTILRIVAGLEDLTQGEVTIGERVVTDLPSKDRDIAMVFQNYALYPHMTVAENLGFGLKLRRAPKADMHARVVQVATVLGLDKLLDRKPAALSGGQRQRVAMGRAMVREPRAFLMDEPLSNLDAKLRVQMRGELARIRDRLRTTTLYVTHDQVEAMTLGNRVAVLRDGILQQVDTPQALFDHPANLFVAAFIGSPSMNLVEATVHGEVLRFGGLSLPAPGGDGLAPFRGRTVILGIRPSDLQELPHEAAGDEPGLPTIEVIPEVIEELGSEVHVIFTVDAPPVSSEHALAAAEVDGADEVLVPLVALEGKSQFTARLDPRARARVGEPLRLRVMPARMHFFDPGSGVAIASRPRGDVTT